MRDSFNWDGPTCEEVYELGEHEDIDEEIEDERLRIRKLMRINRRH